MVVGSRKKTAVRGIGISRGYPCDWSRLAGKAQWVGFFFGLQELCLARAAPINDLLLVSGTRFAREKTPSSIFAPTVLSRSTACSLGIKQEA
jgi:hypothetical protein